MRNALVAGMGAVALIGAAVVAPAIAQPRGAVPAKKAAARPLPLRPGLGNFTPAGADPRLLALASRGGLATAGMRFTPASAVARVGRAVTVAVRARSIAAPATARMAVADPVGSAAPAMAPVAYDMGVAVGWKRLTVSSEIARVERPGLGGREGVDVGLRYDAKRWSTRVAVEADRATPGTPRPLAEGDGYGVDVGGSYKLTRNVDLTAGVRYRATERDRLAPLADNRRDSQAVYVGTAFRF